MRSKAAAGSEHDIGRVAAFMVCLPVLQGLGRAVVHASLNAENSRSKPTFGAPTQGLAKLRNACANTRLTCLRRIRTPSVPIIMIAQRNLQRRLVEPIRLHLKDGCEMQSRRFDEVSVRGALSADKTIHVNILLRMGRRSRRMNENNKAQRPSCCQNIKRADVFSCSLMRSRGPSLRSEVRSVVVEVRRAPPGLADDPDDLRIPEARRDLLVRVV